MLIAKAGEQEQILLASFDEDEIRASGISDLGVWNTDAMDLGASV